MDNTIKLLCRQCRSKLDLTGEEPFSKVMCPVCGAVLRVPMRFGNYLLEKVCGTGGMSIVYRAIDQSRKKRIAIKILQKEFLQEDPEGQRYIAEKNTVDKIAHPGIIPIYDAGCQDSRPYLTMPYMDGGSLEEMLEKKQLPGVTQLCRWLAVIADGLACAHCHNIVHHDLKPGNILLNSSGEARLGDFDLADIRQKGDMHMINEWWASPGYVSPERLTYGGEDHRGDIFSFGITVYELFSGKLPFPSTVNDADLLLKLRREQDFQALYELRRDIPLELSELVTRMLRYAPDARPDYAEVTRILNSSVRQCAAAEGR